MKITPEQIQREYARGVQYKQGCGRHGAFRQNEINERFYLGDQWHGAGCGDDRPLVRQNIIKRIADYKMSVVGGDPVAVTFSAEGIPDNAMLRHELAVWREGGAPETCDVDTQKGRAAAMLSDQFACAAERLQFDMLKQQVMLDAYITGTGVLYTYWDDRLPTGLYADEARTQPVRGDIVSEVLHIDHVYMGDPAVETLQQQPYILITQQREIGALREVARRFGGSWQDIRPERTADPAAPQKATVITRFWKEDGEDGAQRVFGMQVSGTAVIRPKWCLGIRLYPLAVFRWITRSGTAYGESEITHLIPNQIAINRMLTASVWSMMMTGMPIMVVNGDVVTAPVTNDPGQIIPVYGSGDDVERAIRYVEPPAYSSQFTAGISTLISDTLSQAGVSGVVLGDVHPNNASAILAVREASVKPLQLTRSRFFGFCEDVARIWAEFFVHMYGSRPLRLRYPGGYRYTAFQAQACEEPLFSVKVDVEESVTKDQNATVQLLGSLFENKVISAEQYVSRLPEGCIPRQRRLLQEMQAAEQEKQEKQEKEEKEETV